MAQVPPSPPAPAAPRVRRAWLRTSLLPLAVLAAGWSVCAGFFVSGWREQREADAANFNRLAASAETDVLQRVGVYRDALRAGASFLRASRDVSRGEWREFATSLDLGRIYPGIKGIGVIYPVAATELDDFLQRARADGEPGFAVRIPPNGQPGLGDHAIITYIEPQAGNLEAVGLDVGAESHRRTAASAARDSGLPRLTRRIRLVQDGNNRAGFLLYLPVYRAGSSPATLEERRRDHVAWIYAPFIFEELLNQVLADRAGQLRYWVYEGDETRPDHLLHASDTEGPAGGFERQSRLEIAGVTITVGWERGKQFVTADHPPHLLTALSGAGTTLLLAGLILSLQTTGRRARQLADDRTAEVRATQRELEAANRLQRAVLDGTVFSVISTRPDGIIVTFNTGAEKMLGYTRDEVVGRLTPELFHDRDEVAARARELAVELGRPVEPGFEVFVARTHAAGVDEREWTYIRKDGSRLPVWLSVTALRDQAGEITGFLGIATDLTERKRTERALRESEARTRLFAEHAPASVAMFDREMRYLVHSRQWLADYHLDGQNLIGRSHYDVFPEIGAEWKAIHQRCLAGAIERCDADLFVRLDGSRQWLSWEVRPWHTPSGEIGGIVMLTQDITRRKELEENLAKARDEALEASRLKSDFLATMSHEIRTPMNAIVGMTGLLADTPLNAEQREMLRAVSGGAEGLLVIINDALDLSRIEAGQLRLDPGDFDLARVIGETVALLAPAAHEKRLELTCEIDPAPDRLLLGDAGRVRQILMNLIGNAVKFTPAGEVSVFARASAGTGERTRVRIEVRDTGIGIPAAARPRLFEPFVQVDGSSTRRHGGTGLGLAITRQLVVAMGGEIGFESEVGRGSVFWVELEFERRGPLPDLAAEAPPPSMHRPARGLRLLLAEDNAGNQRVASLLLERMGHTVELAANGAVALERLGAEPFDAVLMDCQMPVLDGYEATRRIRSGTLPGVNPRVPVIALTAYARPVDRAHCLAAGMDGYVSKPIRPAELQAALDACRADREVEALPESAAGPTVLDRHAVEVALGLPGRDGGTLLAEMVGLYLQDESARLERLRHLEEARRGTELAEEAHAFGSNAAALGAVDVRRVALQLEAAARAADWPAAAAARLELTRACEQLREALRRLNVAGS